MNTVSKLSIVGAFGALVALTPSGGVLAGPVGVGASAVTPLAAPIETVRWVRHRVSHWHPAYWQLRGGYWHSHIVMSRVGRVVATDLGPTVATDFAGCQWFWTGFEWRQTCPRTGLLGGGGFLGIF